MVCLNNSGISGSKTDDRSIDQMSNAVRLLKEPVIFQQKLAQGIYRLRVFSEHIALNSFPGQFVNIKCGDDNSMLLRRPVSIYNVNRVEKTFDIIFMEKGKGTKWLCDRCTGEKLDLLGPLGKGFTIDITPQNNNTPNIDNTASLDNNPNIDNKPSLDNAPNIYNTPNIDSTANYEINPYNKEKAAEEIIKLSYIGGGIGIFPLYYLMKVQREFYGNRAELHVFLGFRNKEAVILEEEYKSLADKLYIYTDDGSYGKKGLVTDDFAQCASSFAFAYACGPEPMLRKVAQITEALSVECELSLEQRMGCGIGACLVCACKTRVKHNGSNQGHSSSEEDGESWKYSHVCVDGPVFRREDIIFD